MCKKRAVCTFHGIGQGLFYSCEIEMNSNWGRTFFRFVYDCGTLYKEDEQLLERKINDCFKHSNSDECEIDALFLSHFDYDHVSGIPQLMKKFKVKNIFIPYLAPEIMLLLGIKAIEEGWQDEDLLLFQNPIRYFSDYGCNAVFVIGAVPPTNDQINERGENRQVVAETQDFYFSGHNVVRDEKDGTIVYNCGATMTVKSYRADWEFRIYQDQTKETQKSIVKEINRCLGNRSLDELFTPTIQDNMLFHEIKELYKKITNGINQSSMVLYHAPAEKQIGSYNIYTNCKNCGWCYCHDNSVGTLLTGDINTKKLREKGAFFLDFVNLFPHDIGFLQIPHHGSGHNLSLGIISQLIERQCVAFICSYGRGNQFRHPDPYMLDQLVDQVSGQIIHVNQSKSFRYTIEIDC